MCKLNYAGGEPFVHPEYLGEIVTVISNGSLVKARLDRAARAPSEHVRAVRGLI
ncbi:hypothetical protein M427DRAFT_59597 [Gonapodya prolifera JEL478]|uniref:Uncharacterized protein n=1 Tax=Gonapodya prolifera (strain JEL478) TaxID=1344416 RepID=A0A139A7V4_GONPJ|nr:hypothetical protein M427DRAFT_59597 [Gonapodya prolifera JEL478]|eukprot:KXS12453.1 hypothetical protein M427DRAFT_59597 [Gonapodya prolifera JEL478]